MRIFISFVFCCIFFFVKYGAAAAVNELSDTIVLYYNTLLKDHSHYLNPLHRSCLKASRSAPSSHLSGLIISNLASRNFETDEQFRRLILVAVEEVLEGLRAEDPVYLASLMNLQIIPQVPFFFSEDPQSNYPVNPNDFSEPLLEIYNRVQEGFFLKRFSSLVITLDSIDSPFSQNSLTLLNLLLKYTRLALQAYPSHSPIFHHLAFIFRAVFINSRLTFNAFLLKSSSSIEIIAERVYQLLNELGRENAVLALKFSTKPHNSGDYHHNNNYNNHHHLSYLENISNQQNDQKIHPILPDEFQDSLDYFHKFLELHNASIHPFLLKLMDTEKPIFWLAFNEFYFDPQLFAQSCSGHDENFIISFLYSLTAHPDILSGKFDPFDADISESAEELNATLCSHNLIVEEVDFWQKLVLNGHTASLSCLFQSTEVPNFDSLLFKACASGPSKSIISLITDPHALSALTPECLGEAFVQLASQGRLSILESHKFKPTDVILKKAYKVADRFGHLDILDHLIKVYHSSFDEETILSFVKSALQKNRFTYLKTLLTYSSMIVDWSPLFPEITAIFSIDDKDLWALLMDSQFFTKDQIHAIVEAACSGPHALKALDYLIQDAELHFSIPAQDLILFTAATRINNQKFLKAVSSKIGFQFSKSLKRNLIETIIINCINSDNNIDSVCDDDDSNLDNNTVDHSNAGDKSQCISIENFKLIHDQDQFIPTSKAIVRILTTLLLKHPTALPYYNLCFNRWTEKDLISPEMLNQIFSKVNKTHISTFVAAFRATNFDPNCLSLRARNETLLAVARINDLETVNFFISRNFTFHAHIINQAIDIASTNYFYSLATLLKTNRLELIYNKKK